MLLFMPTKVYSEKGCVKNHGKELASFGTKALIVTGKHSAKANGSLADVTAALEAEKRAYVLFDEIEENPSVETVMKARAFGLQEQVDYVIGIGGGSPLDAAKAISLMIANKEQTQEVLYQAETLPYLPIVCVPTTCGTGSEVTPYSILTLHEQKTKQSISHKIYPALALMDAKYLKTMSRNGLVNTCVDALAHLLESYLNTNTNELNRMYTKEGLRAWAQFKDHLKNDAVEDADYEKMMHASMIAGMAITHTGTALPHGLSYPITYELGMPHGRAVGIFLGGYVECYQDRKEAEDAVALLGFDSVAAFRQFMRELLGSPEISEKLLSVSVQAILANPAKLKNYPFTITQEELTSMLN